MREQFDKYVEKYFILEMKYYISRIMKNKIYLLTGVVLMMSVLYSCRRASQLPPLNQGYASSVVLPEPEDLTTTDRAYLRDLKEEYENSIK